MIWRVPYLVFYDSSCGLCCASRALLERLAPAGRLRFLDAGDVRALAEWGIAPRAAQRSIHVVTPAGRITTGFDAVLVLLDAAQAWLRLITLVLRLPPLMWLGERLYEAVSRHRHAFRLGCTPNPEP